MSHYRPEDRLLPMILGASLVGAVLWAFPARAGSFSPPAAAPTPASVGAVARWVPVCGRRGLTGSGGTVDTTDTQAMDQIACFVPVGYTARALRLVYAGADQFNYGVVLRPNTWTLDASIYNASQQITVYTSAATASGSTTLPLQLGIYGYANAVDPGALIAGVAGVPAGAYVTGVSSTFSGNNQQSPMTITLSSATTAAVPATTAVTVNGKIIPALFNGSRTLTVAPTKQFYLSDPVPMNLTGGSEFFVRTFITASTAFLAPADLPSPGTVNMVSGLATTARLMGEAGQRGTSLTDLTMAPTTPSSSGAGYLGPVAVLAQLDKPSPSVVVAGDSISVGTGDQPDAQGNQGFIQRSIAAAHIPYLSIGRGSTGVYEMCYDHAIIDNAVATANATDLLLQYARNDINSGSVPATTVEACLNNIRAANSAVRTWVFTVPPTTISQDAWTTPGGQFFNAEQTTLSSAAAAGASSLALTSAAGMSAGQEIGLTAGTAGTFPTGDTVASVSGNTVTLASPIGAAIPSGTAVSAGGQAASAVAWEQQREQFNTWCRTAAVGAGFAGCIDDDLYLEDPAHTGLWRTDLGQASAEGVHPSPMLHQVIVNAGIINPAMFPAR